ncbi:MAG: hypothetical protein HKL80_00550 [Acidimicrobiales bacterium]|nr:hypothetical protein [Acidimicrobiales bacterium]
MSQLTPDSYEQLEETTIELSKGLNQVIGQRGIAVRVPRAGTLLGIFFSEVDVNDFVGAKKAADSGRYRQFFHAMLKDRIALAPGAYEIMFPSLAHTKADITRTIDAADSAAASMAMHSLSGS